MKSTEQILKEFDKKFTVKSNAGTGLLRYTDADRIKSFLEQSLRSRDEEVVKMCEGMKYEEQHLGSPNIKPTEMFERGFNSAIIQIINKLK
jgi:hypothetical protein